MFDGDNLFGLIDSSPGLSVREAVELVTNNPEYAQHQGMKPNKRLAKLTMNELCHDGLDLDTPIFYSFVGQGKLGDYDCAIIGELIKANKTWIRLGLNFNKIGNLGLSYLGMHAN